MYISHSERIASARRHVRGASQRLALAREQGDQSTVAIFDALLDLAIAYCARAEAASVGPECGSSLDNDGSCHSHGKQRRAS